jgi:hypothetical protein
MWDSLISFEAYMWIYMSIFFGIALALTTAGIRK